MKILIVIFILYVHYASSQYPGVLKKAASPYPKKVRPGLIQYNNAGKYFKPATINTKKPNRQRVFTVFAKPFPTSKEIKEHHQIIPDSPYFPVDEPQQPEGRTRVKKMLPSFVLPIRHKRSADNNGYDERKQLEALAPSGSKTQNRAKHVKSPSKTMDAEGGVKKRNDKQFVRFTPPKKRGQINRIGKKKGVQRETLTQAGVTKQRLRDSKTARINKKHIKPRLERSKILKYSQKKKSMTDRTLKGPLRGVQKRKNKNVKRIAQRQRNNTSKLKGARKPKGPSARRLIAARDALIEEYPYTISIQKDGHHWCSGAILNPRLIITTANCLWRSNTISRLRVRVGSRHTDRGGQVAKIQEVMKHPGWTLRKNPDNDVALALLDRTIRFSHGVHGVDLPNRVMLPAFDDAWITSWGAERRDGIFDTRSVNLQVYHARLIDRNKCNNITKRFAVGVTENFICLSQSGTRAPCTRDTGAPAVSDGVLWGLASWGIRKLCGTERFPAMFSYMASQSNMNFIINATHYLMGEERVNHFPDRYPIKKISFTTPTLMTPFYQG